MLFKIEVLLACLVIAEKARAAEAIPGPREALASVTVQASSTQTASKAGQNLVNGAGLSETTPGSGLWIHTSNAFRERGVERGTMWVSGALDGKLETNPSLVLDFGRVQSLGSLRVWNYNESGWTGIGIKEAEVSASQDGATFTALGRVIVEQAPGDDEYEGQLVSFKQAVEARYLRLSCLSNWQGYDRSGLAEIRCFTGGAGASDAIAPEVKPVAKTRERVPNRPNPPRPAVPGAENIVFPTNSGIIDVTAAPYLAKGDGVTDDTRAIQAALNDYPNAGAIIYLPNGTYVISKTLRWPHGRGGGSEEKNTILQGQSQAGAVIRLKDACPGFTNPGTPKEMVWTGGAPAQRFRNAIRNLTFDTGKGNPGAIGVRFNASNVGCLRDTLIRSGDRSGIIGLDQSYADDFGPCFVKNVTVIGFDTGIAVAHGVNGVVYENITLRSQRKVGWENRGMPITIRNLVSENAVTALRNVEWYGLVTLVDAQLTGVGAASVLPAIHRQAGGLFARNIAVTGYALAIQKDDKAKPEKVVGPVVKEWVSSGPLPGSGERSLGLSVKETPDVPWDSPQDWAVITDFGAKMDGHADDSDAVQRAIDSGKPTVCLPRGTVVLKKPIVIRGNVRRLIGCESSLRLPTPLTRASSIFTVGESAEPVLVVERMACWFWDNHSGVGFIDNPTGRTLVLRELGDVDNCTDWSKGNVISGPGELFIEDVTGRFHLKPGVKAWARYLNPETNQDQRNRTPESQWHTVNEGGQLWVLGIKTEGPGPVITTRQGGVTELLGGLMYSSGGARTQDFPAFIVEDSRAGFCISEANFGKNAYPVLVRVIRNGQVTFELKPGQTPGAPGGSMIPLWATP